MPQEAYHNENGGPTSWVRILPKSALPITSGGTTAAGHCRRGYEARVCHRAAAWAGLWGGSSYRPSWVMAPNGEPRWHHPVAGASGEFGVRRGQTADIVLLCAQLGLHIARQGAGQSASLVQAAEAVSSSGGAAARRLRLHQLTPHGATTGQ